MKNLNIEGLQKYEKIVYSRLKKVNGKYYLIACVKSVLGVAGILKCYVSDNGIDYHEETITVNGQTGMSILDLELVELPKGEFMLYLTVDNDNVETMYSTVSDDLLNWNNKVNLVSTEGICQSDIYDFKIVLDTNIFKVLLSVSTDNGIKLFYTTSTDGVRFISPIPVRININIHTDIFVSGIVKNKSLYIVYCNLHVNDKFTTQVFASMDLETLSHIGKIEYEDKTINCINGVDEFVCTTLTNISEYDIYMFNTDELLQKIK